MWTLRFAGAEELARLLRQLPEALTRQVLITALKAAAQPMRAMASSLAPRSGGPGPHLDDNIVVSTVNRVGSVQGGAWEEQLGEAWVGVGPAKPFFYGLFQEYGTSHQHKFTPFLRPAFDSEATRALPIISEHLWAALRRRIPSSFGFGAGTGRTL